jgi:hypothetical protein
MVQAAPVRGLELRRTEAHLVARDGMVLGIVAPQTARLTTGWRWWTPATSGVAVSLPAALARIAPQRDRS